MQLEVFCNYIRTNLIITIKYEHKTTNKQRSSVKRAKKTNEYKIVKYNFTGMYERGTIYGTFECTEGGKLMIEMATFRHRQ